MNIMKKPTVYIMTNKRNGVLYIGVTASLLERIYQHRNGTGSKFAWKYGCNLLVFYCFFDAITDAIAAEKKLKNVSRKKKIELIESINLEWRDLSPDLFH